MMTVFSQEQALEFALKAKYREGMAQGIEHGIEQGIQQGIERSKSTGKIETLLQIAKKMKDNNMDAELIANFTGLSEAEITNLQLHKFQGNYSVLKASKINYSSKC